MNKDTAIKTLACLAALFALGTAQMGFTAAEADPLAGFRESVAKLGIPLKSGESAHYLLLSNCPASVRTNILRDAEAVHQTLDKKCRVLFKTASSAPLWEGKRVILLFENRQEYSAYWYKLRGATGELALYQLDQFAPGFEGFVANRASRGETGISSALCLYLAPLLLKRHMEDKSLPSWAGTGFALYCQHVLTGTKKDAEQARLFVKQNVADGDVRGYEVMKNTPDFPASDLRGRYLCFSWIDYLASLGEEKFIAFFAGLKNGVEQDAAIREAFGATPSEIEKGWAKSLERLRGTPPRLPRRYP